MTRLLAIALRWLSAALTLAVAAYAAIVVHQFFAYVDHTVYLSVDDALGNTAYALGTHGQYGFPTSPVLLGMSRNNGLFNYGPWYFFLGGALIWLFGYSLTLLRSIHLAAILGAVVAARWWLSDGRPRTPEWALFAVGLLWIFDPGQWPMVRPDIMVSCFAIAFVLAAGRAIERGTGTWWFAAGLFAACGALTHLIAWALIPAAGLVWAIQAFASWRDDSAAPPRQGRALMALVAGGIAAALMFYASFAFRVADQIRFLQGYRALTVGLLAGQGEPVTYLSLVRRHYAAAFGWFPPILQRGAIAMWVLSVAMVFYTSRRRTPVSRDVSSRVMPPLIAWTCYLASLGFYANFHTGYTMLNQFLALWLAAAVLRVLIRSAGIGARDLALVTIAGALVLTTTVLAQQKLTRPNYRVLRADTWVGIDRYVDEVLSWIPRGATAWGTAIFGLENPDRIQLIQYFDAVLYTPQIPATERAGLAPEFLVWSYPENRGVPSDVATRQPTWPQTMAAMFPGIRYEPAALIGADPYGVTRVYVRHPRSDAHAAPAAPVAVFDSARRQWARTTSAPIPDAFAPWSPAMRIETTRAAEPRWVSAAHSYRAELPAGDYVAQVFLRTGSDETSARMIVASSAPSIEVTRSELAPAGDICAFGANDTMVQLVLMHHPGGSAYIGDFDSTAGAAVERIEVARLEPLTPSRLAAAAAIAIAPSDWTALAGVGANNTASGALTVRGNASQYGYQVMSRLIDLTPGARVALRIRVERAAGSICVGVLDKTTQRWLVTADRFVAEARFVADQSGGAHVVIANCNPDATGNVASAFTIEEARIEIESAAGYADRFMKAAVAAGAIKP